MPHQTPHSPSATSQNAATDRQPPNDPARGQHRSVRPDPGAYVAEDYQDASLAGPAAGEVGDYADEGDPSMGAQQGATRTNVPEHRELKMRGRKTLAAQRQQIKGG